MSELKTAPARLLCRKRAFNLWHPLIVILCCFTERHTKGKIYVTVVITFGALFVTYSLCLKAESNRLFFSLMWRKAHPARRKYLFKNRQKTKKVVKKSLLSLFAVRRKIRFICRCQNCLSLS